MPALRPLLRAHARILARRVLAPGERLRAALFLVLLVAFVFSARYLSRRVFAALLSAGDLVELVGLILTMRLIALFLLLIWAMLLFGTLITVLENFYGAEDIDFLVEKPISQARFSTWKTVKTYLETSWVVYLTTLPFLAGYGAATSARFSFLPLSVVVLFLLSLPPFLAGSLFVFALMRAVPVNRAKELLVGAGFLLSLALVGFYRLLSPKRIFVRGRIVEDFFGFLERVQMPIHPLLPSNTAARAIVAARGRDWDAFLSALGVLGGTAVVCAVFYFVLAPRLYAADRPVSRAARRPFLTRLFRRPPRTAEAALARKEFLLYLRDPTQISHLVLLSGVLLLHLVNLTELPVAFSPQARALLAFLNLGLAGFLLAAVSSRFVYPALSLEGRPFVHLLASPLPLEVLYRIKHRAAAVPLAGASLLVVLVGNLLVGAAGPLTALFSAAAVVFALVVTATGAAAGALAPRFDTPNVFEISSSPGGVLYILVALLYILLSIVCLTPATFSITFSPTPWAALVAPASLGGIGLFAILSAGLGWASGRLGRRAVLRLAEEHPEIFA